MSKISPVPLKFCHQWSSGHLFFEIFHRNLIEASKFYVRTEVVEGKAQCKPLVFETGNKLFPKKEKWGWEWKSFVAKQDMFWTETPWIQGRIFTFTPFSFLMVILWLKENMGRDAVGEVKNLSGGFISEGKWEMAWTGKLQGCAAWLWL